jgi:conserved hypothetical protein
VCRARADVDGWHTGRSDRRVFEIVLVARLAWPDHPELFPRQPSDRPMYRHAAFLVREAGTGHEAFTEHWQTEHTPIACAAEGVVRYLTTTPLDPAGAAFDGIADLYFDDLGTLHDALGGEGDRDHDPQEETAAGAREDIDDFLAVTEYSRLIGEETVQFDATDGLDPETVPYRRSILLTRREGMTHDEFRDYWLEEHAPLAEAMLGLARYTATLPTAPAHAEFDGVADLYFTDRDAMLASMGQATDEYDPEHEALVAVNEDAAAFLDLGAIQQFAGEWAVQTDRTD